MGALVGGGVGGGLRGSGDFFQQKSQPRIYPTPFPTADHPSAARWTLEQEAAERNSLTRTLW